MNCVPLRLSPQWPDLRRRSLLVGFPLIGPQVGAYLDIRAQLAQRTPECWSLWGPDPARIEAAQYVAKTLAAAVEWPNPIFIPADPCELLFWDHKSCAIDDLSLVGAWVEIETHFNVNPSEKELDTLGAGTFGGFVDYLLAPH